MNSILKSALIAIILISSLIGCEKIELTNYAANAQEEMDLLRDFYENTYNHKYDSILNLAIDTIDERKSSGILLMHRVIGDGVKVEYGKSVGFKYTRYLIGRDSLKTPQLYTSGSNLKETDLFVYTAGYTSGTTLINSAVSAGLDYAIRKLNKEGQATIVIPSTISTSSLNEIWDIDIQYIGK